jgi:hypothetical protein
LITHSTYRHIPHIVVNGAWHQRSRNANRFNYRGLPALALGSLYNRLTSTAAI